ncbi:transcriptional regulator [Vibrio sp. UCD-FRSSP16_10]|uniref:transcriptional regulator n=1 Tax=unclassified Vibrio TaxID=2614977 RepID=UPI00080215BE|nr:MULTISPECIES: transcriptional regulator [unclassified Vibrio]OBT08610.1 transcriptional regulator [Vibrio sp. UCD-FRSSP16_30]OBT18140.1 transcriptional regulator [Vibrio sp. UCD-FRSSP16_10]
MSKIGIKYVLAQKYIFDPKSNSLIDQSDDDSLVRLGSNESRILLLLCEHHNEVVTRDQLHEFVWRDQGFQVDDSSLTQAISTLRKMLKDSTKSPEFVKTVPKRGYQLISSVEPQTLESLQEEATTFEAEPALASITTATATTTVEPTIAPTPEPKKQAFWTCWDTNTRIILVIALLLPIIALVIPNSAPASFRSVTVVNDIPVKTTEGHPPLTQWVDSIKTCVNYYVETYPNESAPVEVIATASQSQQLFLSYIHRSEFTSENSTVRLVADQQDLAQICATGDHKK